jgi:hypothetical protein
LVGNASIRSRRNGEALGAVFHNAAVVTTSDSVTIDALDSRAVHAIDRCISKRRWIDTSTAIHRIGCNINTLPRLTSAGATPTHGEAIGTLGLIVTTGRRCLARACLEMTALAIALHELVRTLTRGRILGRKGQVTISAFKIARIGIRANGTSVIRIRAMRGCRKACDHVRDQFFHLGLVANKVDGFLCNDV